MPWGIKSPRESGRRPVTPANGTTAAAERPLASADLLGGVEILLSVDDAGIWEPSAGAYHPATRQCGARVEDMLMVAVHPWDLDGAARAGLRTAWVDRAGSAFSR